MRKEWKEKRENRIKEANNQCKWCGAGSEDNLTVHHK